MIEKIEIIKKLGNKEKISEGIKNIININYLIN